MATRFIVTRTFLDGTLKGITIDDNSLVSFEPGKVYGCRGTGGKYRVEACKPA